MNSHTKKRILLVVTNSYAAMNVIHSGLIKLLAEEYEVHIISNLIHEKEIVEICDYFNIRIYKADIPIPVESSLIKVMRKLEKAIFFQFYQIETQKIKEESKGLWYRFFQGNMLIFINFLGISAWLLKFLRKGIIKLASNYSSLEKLNDYDFCGVISSSPLDIRESIIVNFMKKKNIPSIAMIISWDNLTSKGIINADHDYVLVWNELMANEYKRFYSVFDTPNQQIHITGIPRFDIYFKKTPDEYSPLEFRKRYQIDALDKIILFATSAIIHFPNQADIVEHLLEYAFQKQKVKVILRCHAGDDFDLYKKFIHNSQLIIWQPDHIKTIGNTLQQMPDLQILNSLATMMKICDVCLNVASTIRLEAAVCKKPNISIAYDGNLNPEFRNSVKRFYAYSHQLPLNKLGIDKMVYSKTELFNSLDEMLFNPFCADNYVDKIQPFIYHSGPFAVPATIKSIRQCLN